MNDLAILAAVAIVVWGGVAVQRNRLRHRREELVHEARMAAIQNGMAPELPLPLEPHAPRRSTLEIVDRLSLLVGMVLLAGGLGYFAGLSLVPPTPEMGGMSDLAPLGLVAAAAGAGFLIYAAIARRLRP